MTRVTGDPVRDDRILPFTRILASVIAAVLLLAFVILYLLPDRTDQLFAWTIEPRMTPMLMGAGYIAGAYFFVRVAVGERWDEVGLGLLPPAAFATVQALDGKASLYTALYVGDQDPDLPDAGSAEAARRTCAKRG